MDAQEGKSEQFAHLLAIVERLRGSGGCPWDRRQTIPSLARYVIEEAYELVEAIETGEAQEIGEEVGDLLMILLLIAQIAEERGEFHIGDALGGIARKLIRRHPHVFGGTCAPTQEDVVRNWEAIKRQERPGQTSPADGIPRTAPALLQAYRLAERVERAGGALRPPPTEVAWRVLSGARASDDRVEVERALGTLLLSLAWEARDRGIEPEGALRTTLREYRDRLAPAAGDAAAESDPTEAGR